MKAIILSDDVLSFRKVIKSIDANDEIDIVESFSLLKNIEEFVSAHDVDVIFVDVTSKKEEKINFIQKIRLNNNKIYTILISDSKEDSYIAYGLNAIGFLLKPYEENQIKNQLENINKNYPFINKKVVVRTFGNFSVSVNGEPVKFSLAKSREILAYLINLQGTEINWPTLAAEVFDEDLYDSKTYARLHKSVERLRKILKEYKVEDILISKKGYLAIDVNKIDCDLYKFIAGDKVARASYYGELMKEYSWAENRASYLDSVLEIKKF